MKNIRQIKKELAITDNDLAEFFGYKSHMAYRNSSAKKRIESGIEKMISLWERHP